MKIFCPNCDAEYEVKDLQNLAFEQNVQCAECSQEWLQYNFSRQKKTNVSKENELKKLAFEEYQISKTGSEDSNDANIDEVISDIVRLRLKNSSNKLRETTQSDVNDKHSEVSSTAKINAWTLLGFSISTVIFFSAFLIYIFNFQLQVRLPIVQGSLLNYQKFIDQVIEIINNFFMRILY